MTALLSAEQVTVRYGGVVANDAIDLQVERGEFVGLIGANGAGKSSFVDGVTGFTALSSGRVLFRGRDITELPPHRRAEAGLVRTFQAGELFEDMTIADNVFVATDRGRWRNLLADMVRRPGRGVDDETVAWALRLVGIADLAGRRPEEVSNGQRKLVGVARALASKPEAVILDEPAAGLDAEESRELAEVLRGLPAAGISVLLIDHDMGLILTVCDRICVLDFGKKIDEGTPAEIRRSKAVISAYLGEEQPEGAMLAGLDDEGETP